MNSLEPKFAHVMHILTKKYLVKLHIQNQAQVMGDMLGSSPLFMKKMDQVI